MQQSSPLVEPLEAAADKHTLRTPTPCDVDSIV